jgi:hypothetical protein
VIGDTRLLWEERQRLIEDVRQLADEVLGTADDAVERLKLPEQLGSATDEVSAEAAAPGEEPTAVEPLPLGAVEDEPADAPIEEEPAEESGHTVELEALPGGSEEPPEQERG